MSKRFLVTFALAAFVSTVAEARNGFGRSRRSSRPATPTQRYTQPRAQVPAAVLNDPEQMTKKYGPSILIREPATAVIDDAKFVGQPK